MKIANVKETNVKLIYYYNQASKPNYEKVHLIIDGESIILFYNDRKVVNFGKYEVPSSLKTLIEVERELKQEGYRMKSVIGFYLSLEHSGYFNTPFDVIAFGWTGVDGEHFGFLTDFGSADDLENAPIVMVSPMNFDQPTVLIANNIQTLLRIAIIDPILLYVVFLFVR
jgi:hypothetical protein